MWACTESTKHLRHRRPTASTRYESWSQRQPRSIHPLGGATALGHPLGCTGAQMVSALLHELHRRQEVWEGGETGPGGGSQACALGQEWAEMPSCRSRARWHPSCEGG
mmetsp:Transcript_1345/g.2723  ORF Transcript_1345/g.2723 Transcript_1345/m.2723 type:complete len:108 (-) Transcript_1345:159-482(-)